MITRVSMLALVLIAALVANGQPVAAPSTITSIDPVAELNKKLRAKGLFRKERWIQVDGKVCTDGCCGKGCAADCTKCRPGKVDKLEQYTDVLSIGSVEAVKVNELAVDSTQIVELPENLHITVARMENCGKSDVQQTFTLSKTVTIGESVTVGTSLTHGTALRAGLKANIGKLGTLSTDVTVNTSATLTNSKTETTSTQVTRSQSATLKVQPGNWGRVELLVFEVGAEIPFTGDVTFDGPVDANLDGISQASQLLSEAERTIRVSGVVQATAASDSILRFFENKLPTCAEQMNAVVTQRFETAVPSKGFSTAIIPPGSGPLVVKGPNWRLSGAQTKGQSSIKTLKGGMKVMSKRKVLSAEAFKKKYVGAEVAAGATGDICHIEGCNFPYDGYRTICYFDEEGGCTDCWEEYDPVCDVDDPNPVAKAK